MKQEAKDDKFYLEKAVEMLLTDFERRTGFIPTQIDVMQITAFGNKKNVVAGVKIKIEDNSYPAFHV